MKFSKKILIILFFFSFVLDSKAQFDFGVKGGVNFSNIVNTPFENTLKPSFHTGVLIQYMLNKNTGIETGLYYSILGSKEKVKFETYNIDYEYTSNPSYLQIPVLYVYKYEIRNNIQIYPTIGFYLGYGIKGKRADIQYEVNEAETIILSANNINYFNDSVNRFEIGVSIGTNLQLKKFIFSFGYEHGLSKINKNNKYYNLKLNKLQNQNIKMSIGYLF